MQDQAQNSHGMEIEVSEVEALRLTQNLARFQQLLPQMQARFQESPDRIYYLVSTKFIEEWKNLCRQTSVSRVQPRPMNHDLVASDTKKLVEGLLEGENFLIVNKEIFKLWEDYPQEAVLKRIAYGEGDQKKVPIYTEQLSYLTLSQKDLIAIDKKLKPRSSFKTIASNSLSKDNTIKDLIVDVRSAEIIHSEISIRMWLHKKSITLDLFYTQILKQCQPQAYDRMKVKSMGTMVEDENIKIGDLDLEEGDYFVIECVEKQTYALKRHDEGMCEQCRKVTRLLFICPCKQVAYCSSECQDKDKKYHYPRCRWVEQEELKKPLEMVFSEQSRRGLVGLQNLGNTCFMNSCLQCLSNTLPLTKYFLDSDYASEINNENPIGSKGRLAQAYAHFIKNMWCEEDSVFRPSRLKLAIADINKMFSGYAQHDSQQLFSFLVDGLHQDLNRIKKKPYVESVDSNGRPDNVVAEDSWLAYTQRNQSIITDIMVGQYKSKVTCPDCGKQSITFDPFNTVTLPIPEKWTQELLFYVLFQNNEENTLKISVTYKNKNIDEIYQKVAKEINRTQQQFDLYILSMDDNIHNFRTTPKNELFTKLDNINSFSSSLFVIEVSKSEQNLQNRVALPVRMSKKETFSHGSLFFKRPYYFDYEKTTGLDVTVAVLKYLYNDTYNDSIKRAAENRKKGHSYEQYLKMMLENRPFKVYVRSQKKTKLKYSSYFEVDFQKEQPLEENQLIKQLIDVKNIEDYQIDIRFSGKGLQKYTIERLKNFQDKTKKSSSYKHEDDDSDRNVSLAECLQALQHPEQLEKGNEWYCPSCKDHKLATKELFIYKTPEILILHLKRFKSKGTIRRQKNEANVDFPLELDMSKYLVCHEPMQTYIPYLRGKQKFIEPSYPLQLDLSAKPIYQLYAISNHYGSLTGGHYTAFAKNDGKWYSFNDSSVSAVGVERIKGSGAYMLFYRRKPN